MSQPGGKTRIRSLDGFRAFAMFAVVASHTALPLGWGGWLGVDAFFVLSGYLITDLLLDERRRTGTIAIGGFYLLRAARLYPALLALVALGAPFAGLVGDPRRGYLLTATLAVTYTENLWIWATGGLGGNFSHLWSLAVEEQFYLLWPIVVFGIRSRRKLLATTIGAMAISFIFMATNGGHVAGVTQGYYLPQARAWELLAGALLAMVLRRSVVGERAAATASWLGAVGLAGTLLLVGQFGSLRSGIATSIECLAVVLLSAALITGLRSGPSLVRAFLELRMLQWLGRISYGIYLFHVLVLAVIDNWLQLPTVANALVVFAVSVALAGATFRWVESPIRRFVRRATPARSRAAIDHAQISGATPLRVPPIAVDDDHATSGKRGTT